MGSFSPNLAGEPYGDWEELGSEAQVLSHLTVRASLVGAGWSDRTFSETRVRSQVSACQLLSSVSCLPLKRTNPREEELGDTHPSATLAHQVSLYISQERNEGMRFFFFYFCLSVKRECLGCHPHDRTQQEWAHSHCFLCAVGTGQNSIRLPFPKILTVFLPWVEWWQKCKNKSL